MIPGPPLNELISQFDLKQQALCSPLTPSSAQNDDAFPPSVYAPEFSYDIHTLKQPYKGSIDDPSRDPTPKASWANTPFPRNTWAVINNLGEPVSPVSNYPKMPHFCEEQHHRHAHHWRLSARLSPP